MFIIHNIDKTVSFVSYKIEKVEFFVDSFSNDEFYGKPHLYIKINNSIICDFVENGQVTEEKVLALKDDILKLLVIDNRFNLDTKIREYHITSNAELHKTFIYEETASLIKDKNRLWN